jgi:uncharacterized repeat protein (TIGR01451 family)
VTVTINPNPNPPVADDDAATTGINTAVNIPVLDGDTDPDNNLDTTSVSIVTPPTNGSVVVNNDGTVTYTPNNGYTGTDTFTYRVCDTTSPTPLCDTAQVTVTIEAPNVFDPPRGIKVLNAQGLPELEWTMVWINDSNVTAINVQVSDTIPAGTTYVPNSLTCEERGTSTETSCFYDAGTNRIVWQGTIGADLGATDEATATNEVVLVFRITVPDGVNEVANTATSVTDRDGDNDFSDEPPTSIRDSNEVRWTRGLQPTAPAAGTLDVAITKIGSSAIALPGDEITWIITVTNRGTAAASNVVVSDTLPEGLELLSSVSSVGLTTTQGRTVSATVPSLAPGQAVILTIRTRVAANVAPQTEITNIAAVDVQGAARRTASATVRILSQVLPATGERTEAPNLPWQLAVVTLGGMVALYAVWRMRVKRPA